MSLPNLIELENVTVWRGDRPALDCLTLTIGQGEHVAILGPNGCGKSTFIKTLTRECYPRYAAPASRVRILGEERWHVEKLRSLLGIVTNDLAAICTQNYPAREIVMSGFFSAIGIWPWHEVTAEMREAADYWLNFVGLHHLADRPLTQMSSGEVRRTVIARALVHTPQALVLDEPTTSLDISAFRELHGIMSRLADSGVTIVLVTHHLPDIIPQIQRVIGLRAGRLHCDGGKPEILREEVLSGLFATSVKVAQDGDHYQMW